MEGRLGIFRLRSKMRCDLKDGKADMVYPPAVGMRSCGSPSAELISLFLTDILYLVLLYSR